MKMSLKMTIAKRMAETFLARCEDVSDRAKKDNVTYPYYTKESSNMKRASMDLTRALSDLRRSDSRY